MTQRVATKNKDLYKYWKRALSTKNWQISTVALADHTAAHLGPAQKVQMQVKNGLACVIATVEYGSKPASRDSHLAGKVLSRPEEVRENRDIVQFHIQHIFHVNFWNDQDVDRGLRRDVFERENMFVFKNFFRGKSPLDDFAKDAFLRLLIRHTSSGRRDKLPFPGHFVEVLEV